MNAGAIDISYEQSSDSSSSNSKSSSKSGSSGKSSNGNSESGNRGQGGFGGGQGMPPMPGGFGGFMQGGKSSESSKINQEKITLSEDDMDDLKTFLPGISDITISYTTKSDVDGGELDDAESYTIAGVKNN